MRFRICFEYDQPLPVEFNLGNVNIYLHLYHISILRSSKFFLVEDMLFLLFRNNPQYMVADVLGGASRGYVYWLVTNSTHYLNQHWPIINWGVLCQEQASRAGTSNDIPQNLWDVITCPCYVLPTQHSWIRPLRIIFLWMKSKYIFIFSRKPLR